MAWDWGAIIPAVIGAYGAYKDRDSASSPEMPESLDYEQILSLIMQNSKSPWGNTTYSQGEDGMYTREYEFTPQQQAIYDRGVDRSLNPDQAYQMPGQLQALQEALMNQRLSGMGMAPGGQTPRTSPRPAPRTVPGGSRPTGPFTPAPDPVQPGTGGNGGAGSGYTTGGGQSIGQGPAGGSYGGGMYMPGNYSYGGPQRNPGSSGGGLNLPPGAEQGRDPSGFEQFLVENAGNIGHGAGALTGIPGLGFLGNQMADRYWQNNAWQSPAQNLPPSGNDLINQAVDSQPGSAAALRDLAGGNQSPAAPETYYGSLGPWQGTQTGGTGPISWSYGRNGGYMPGGSGFKTNSIWWMNDD